VAIPPHLSIEKQMRKDFFDLTDEVHRLASALAKLKPAVDALAKRAARIAETEWEPIAPSALEKIPSAVLEAELKRRKKRGSE
jgi:hypothetical protein